MACADKNICIQHGLRILLVHGFNFIWVHRVLCNIDIAWHNGSLRSNFFTIAISKDGIYFQIVYNGRSTGTTSWFERYSLLGIPANYIQITINGNTMNNFVGINKVRINGY